MTAGGTLESCPIDTPASLDYDPLMLMINGYKYYYALKWNDDVSSLKGIKSYVYGRNACVDADGKIQQPVHVHQKRIPTTTLDAAAETLIQNLTPEKLSEFLNFEDLFNYIKECGPKTGFKQICVYDTALRLVYSNNLVNLQPAEFVYLHRGALKGARALWKIDTLLRLYKKHSPMKPLNRKKANCDDFPEPDKGGFLKVPINFFCKQLQELGASGIEDFLCVYHFLLEGYYLRIAASLLY